MIGAYKTPLGVKTKNVEVAYRAFQIGGTEKSGVLTADSAENCECVGGMLAQAPKVVHYQYNSSVSVDLSDAALRRIFLSTEKNADGEESEIFGYVSNWDVVHIYDSTQRKTVALGTLSGCSHAVRAVDKEGNYKTLFASADGIYRLESGKLLQVSELACLPAICVYKGRVFTAVEGGRLAYSAPYEPTDFTETLHGGGRIRLDTHCGEIVGLTPFKNKLCVLFEHGISMLEIAGTARDFVRRDIPYGGDMIYGKTACVGSVGGEKVFFLSGNGVHSFDGAKVEKVCKNLNIFPMEMNALAQTSGGKYLFVYHDFKGVRHSVSVDAESGEGAFTCIMYGLGGGVGRTFFWDGLSSVWEVSQNGAMPTGKKSAFTVSDTDLSVAGEKTLKALRFAGEGSFTLRVSDGKREKTQTVVLNNGRARARITGLRGKTFTIGIVLGRDARICGMTAELQTMA